MAKRKMLFHPDYVREKIRASQLINRLQKCAFGEINLGDNRRPLDATTIFRTDRTNLDDRWHAIDLSVPSSGSTSQLVQAMAGFGGSSGAADGVNVASVGSGKAG